MVTPYPPQSDGIGFHAQNLIEALPGTTDTFVLTRRRQSDRRSANVRQLRLLSASPASLYRSVRALGTLRPDVIHFQFNIPALGTSWLWGIMAGAVERWRHGARLVFTLHEVRRDIDLMGPLGVWLFRLIGHVADSIIVYTTEARELLIARCQISTDKIAVMPHGAPVSYPELTPTRREELFERYEVAGSLVICIGYIHPDKGIEHLVEAMALIQEASPASLVGVTLLVAGSVRKREGVFRYFERKDHRYESELRNTVERLGLTGLVRFAGFVPQDDLIDLMVSARLAVLPYLNATQSGVLNLLLAARAPVVASNLPGLAETLGEAGLFAAPGNAHELADQVRLLLDRDDIRSSLVEKLFDAHAKVTFESVAARLTALYRQLAPTAT